MVKSTVSIETNQFDVHTAPASRTGGHQPPAAEVLRKCLQLQLKSLEEKQEALSAYKSDYLIQNVIHFSSSLLWEN